MNPMTLFWAIDLLILLSLPVWFARHLRREPGDSLPAARVIDRDR